MPRTTTPAELQGIYAAGHARIRARCASLPDLGPTMSASGSRPQHAEPPRSNGWTLPSGPQALDDLMRLARTVAAGIVGPSDRRRAAPVAARAAMPRAATSRVTRPRTAEQANAFVRATWTQYHAQNRSTA